MILLSLALVVASATALAAGIFLDSDPLIWASLGAGLGAVALVAGSVMRRRRPLPVAAGSDVATATGSVGAAAVGSTSPGGPPGPSLTPSRSASRAGAPSPPDERSWPWATGPPGGASAPDAPRHGWTGAVPAVPADTRPDPANSPPPGRAVPADGPPAADGPGGTGAYPADGPPAADAVAVGAFPADEPAGPVGQDRVLDYGAGSDGEPAIEPLPVRDALRVAQLADEVVVLDGHPRYHLAGCPTLAGAATQPLAVSAARRTGFTPCAVCAPDRTLLDRSRARTAGRSTEP